MLMAYKHRFLSQQQKTHDRGTNHETLKKKDKPLKKIV